ncbi:MAG: DUF3472 domain-containing protein [Planctomycetaceae bacterium]|nr:DUF3472 domain-containing protein [Planctomycetaceae bacterium]
MHALSRRQWLQITAAGVGAGLWNRASQADEKLKDIACRSVHLGYPKAEGVAFYNTCRPITSAPGTYFSVCGWDAGYYGIQELANGDKLALFSIWDSEKNDPNAAPVAERVKTEHVDPRVRVKRFGGEGSGGQSFFPLKWSVNETYRFIVSMTHKDGRASYSNWLFEPEAKVWTKLVTFSVPSKRTQMRGLYSFVEDFKRDRQSTTFTRRAQFGPAAVRSAEGTWQPLHQARFTGDANPVVNIDSQIVESRFELATGGMITNEHNPLNQVMTLPDSAVTAIPEDLPQTL